MQDERIIQERIFPGRGEPIIESPGGVTLRSLVSSACGAQHFYTGTATFQPRAVLPLHTHKVSEAITILQGLANVQVEGRTYCLEPLDCIHVPAFIAHRVYNNDPLLQMIAHSTFAEAQPTRTIIEESERRFSENAAGPFPETLRRFRTVETYELSEGTLFCDLFAKRLGADGICGGYGRFKPGSSLPCHIHKYDESITIVTGEALCQVSGREYRLSGYETAYVPEGSPHRFLNVSNQIMAMIWVYAGDEPDRILLDAGYCSGSLVWHPT
jgi:putative monooxygenase